MQHAIQQIVDGFAAGSIYGALALALVLVYRATGMINFAQGLLAVASNGDPNNLAVDATQVYFFSGSNLVTACK